MTIRSKDQLAAAIRRAEMQGARLSAGSQFGSKTERQACGELLTDLANVARRAFDIPSAKAWYDALPQRDSA